MEAVSTHLSDSEKLEMLNQLEKSGLGWFWASDSDGRLTYLSPAVAERVNVPVEQMLGQSFASVFETAEREERSKSLALMFGAHRAFSGYSVRASANRGAAVLKLAGQPIFVDGEFSGFRGTGTDITAEFQHEAETERLAKYDSLTGLVNRHHMKHMMETAFSTFQAVRRNCAIFMLDLDKFKHVNDTLGHAAGDELLRQVADRLKRSIEVDCEIGRLGGDEFQVMIPDKDDRGELGDIAKKIIEMLTQPYSLEEGRCVIGCSIGIAVAPHDGVSVDEVVRSADLALYAAKNSGRGRHCFYSGELENEAIFRRRLEETLGTALQEDQLFLKYEPVVCAKSGVVCALEAHICWQHEQRGEIDEVEFAAIIEGSSHALDIGRWALGEACSQAAEWPETTRLAINVPVEFFAADGFVDCVSRALAEAQLSANRLEITVSEAVFIGDGNIIDGTLAALFKLGVHLTLGDFGGGFSSLSYLRNAPFDAVRIDDNLIEECTSLDDKDFGLVKAIVALAGALEMDVVAGGIETADVLERLKVCGVAKLEGLIYSEPVLQPVVLDKLHGQEWKIAANGDRLKRAKRRTVFRKIEVIHGDHSYEVTLRNLSRTGALIQGLRGVPKGTQFVVDLGSGQLAVATVIRTNADTQGLEFEQALIDDGSGGLCTRNRVSPYALAAAGEPLAALSPNSAQTMLGIGAGNHSSPPQFSYATASQDQAA